MPLRHKVNLPYIFNLNSREIKFRLSVQDNSKIKGQIKHFKVRVETNNEKFVRFIFFFKLGYFLLSLFVFAKYHKKLSLQLKTTVLLEQKIIYALGVLTRHSADAVQHALFVLLH